MTKVIDSVENFADDAIDGIVEVYGQYVRRIDGGVVRSSPLPNGRVAVVVGGGSGHYPAFAGLVGPGFAAGAVCGNVFTSPSAGQAFRVAKAAQSGGGVLFSYGNYAGDVLHFGLAADKLRANGIDVRTVLVTDDIASAPVDEAHRRRGIAGDFVVFKIASASAERGDNLDEVERLARHANARTRTLGVAFSGCTLPGSNHPLFTVPEGAMSIGLGIHGEPGIQDAPLATAGDLAEILVTSLLKERVTESNRVAVVLNGLGTVAYEELFVVYKSVSKLLRAAHLEVIEPEAGELVTSLDMGGLSLTLLWLDEELEELWRAPAATPAYRKGALTVANDPREKDDATDASERAYDEESYAALGLADRTQFAIERVSAVLHDHREELGLIDAVAGDGDHGIGMSRGIEAAGRASAAARTAGAGAFSMMEAAGDAWAERAGGTSGALWGAAINAAANVLRQADGVDDSAVVAAVESALAAITDLGKAELGDKTMVDAFQPFAVELRRRYENGEQLGGAWASAVVTAKAAGQATASLRPKLGRARPLAERSVGHPDAGAISFGLIVDALGKTEEQR